MELIPRYIYNQDSGEYEKHDEKIVIYKVTNSNCKKINEIYLDKNFRLNLSRHYDYFLSNNGTKLIRFNKSDFSWIILDLKKKSYQIIEDSNILNLIKLKQSDYIKLIEDNKLKCLINVKVGNTFKLSFKYYTCGQKKLNRFKYKIEL